LPTLLDVNRGLYAVSSKDFVGVLDCVTNMKGFHRGPFFHNFNRRQKSIEAMKAIHIGDIKLTLKYFINEN
jgi:hypothetical protein